MLHPRRHWVVGLLTSGRAARQLSAEPGALHQVEQVQGHSVCRRPRFCVEMWKERSVCTRMHRPVKPGVTLPTTRPQWLCHFCCIVCDCKNLFLKNRIYFSFGIFIRRWAYAPPMTTAVVQSLRPRLTGAVTPIWGHATCRGGSGWNLSQRGVEGPQSGCGCCRVRFASFRGIL